MTIETSLPAGEIRRLPVRRARIEDDLAADYLAMAVQPGDRTLQIGGSELGAVCLRRGAHHEIVAPLGVIEGLQAVCDRRSIPTDALRGGPALRPGSDGGPIDLAIISPDSGFPALAAHWRHIAARLREGGALVLLEANRGAVARLAAALGADTAWVLEQKIGGGTAVFRKALATTREDARSSLAASPVLGRKPHDSVAGRVRGLFARRHRPA